MRSSADNFAADIGITTTTLTTFTGTNISLTGSDFQNVTGSLTFRVYVFDTADNGNRGELLDNIIVNGSVIAIPEPSTLDDVRDRRGASSLSGSASAGRKVNSSQTDFGAQARLHSLLANLSSTEVGDEPAKFASTTTMTNGPQRFALVDSSGHAPRGTR